MNEREAASENGLVATGIRGFDNIIGGGFTSNRLYLVEGNPGSGKTTLALQYLLEGVRLGERVLYITLSETAEELRVVAESHGWSLDQLDLVELIPSDESLTPESQYTMFHPSEVELAETTKAVLAEVERINHVVRQSVEQNGSRLLIIDSLNGYINAMPDERFLLIQLHELFTYLGRQGVTTFLVVAQHGLVGRDMQSPIDASYLADTVILLRYFEARGEVRQAISVMKKRSGLHERTIRELRIDRRGLHVGAPLSVFQGVLNGTPEYIGHRELLSEQPDGRTSE